MPPSSPSPSPAPRPGPFPPSRPCPRRSRRDRRSRWRSVSRRSHRSVAPPRPRPRHRCLQRLDEQGSGSGSGAGAGFVTVSGTETASFVNRRLEHSGSRPRCASPPPPPPPLGQAPRNTRWVGPAAFARLPAWQRVSQDGDDGARCTATTTRQAAASASLAVSQTGRGPAAGSPAAPVPQGTPRNSASDSATKRVPGISGRRPRDSNPSTAAESTCAARAISSSEYLGRCWKHDWRKGGKTLASIGSAVCWRNRGKLLGPIRLFVHGEKTAGLGRLQASTNFVACGSQVADGVEARLTGAADEPPPAS